MELICMELILQVCKLELSVKVTKPAAPAARSVSPGWGLMKAPGPDSSHLVSTASTFLPWQRGSHVTTAGRLDLVKTASSAIGRRGSVKVEIIALFFIFILILLLQPYLLVVIVGPSLQETRHKGALLVRSVCPGCLKAALGMRSVPSSVSTLSLRGSPVTTLRKPICVTLASDVMADCVKVQSLLGSTELST